MPALIFGVFVILCVLSLLAFMDDETTGACDIWAGCLLVWYAVHSVAREALVAEGAATDEAMSTLGLTEPIFAAPLAVALAQLLARALGQHIVARKCCCVATRKADSLRGAARPGREQYDQARIAALIERLSDAGVREVPLGDGETMGRTVEHGA